MLKYTGHPLVDVGIATIVAFVGKRDPTDLTEEDIETVADYIAREYIRQPLQSFLTVAFPNSGFTQPAFEKTPERRLDYAERVLRGYRAEVPRLEETCVFTGEPAIAIAFGDKQGLPLGRAFRQHIPLTLGEDTINFHPYGDAGLPVSGKALLAIQAFPLGCAKCGGRLLAVHSDNEELTLHFAKAFLVENRKSVQLAQAAGSTKMPEPHFSHRTLLIDTLLQADEMQTEYSEDEKLFSLTIYHLSNSGQGPALDIYQLPFEISGFLREMQQAQYRLEWQAIVRRAWEVPPETKRKSKKDEPFKPSRNWLYEDLFDLPDNAARFIRTYFLRVAMRYARDKTDPRVDYSLRDEANLVSWKITARFLRRIMHMDKERIESIRNMGDQLADYVASQNDRRFFRDFYVVQRYEQLRTALVKANLAHVRRGNAPIVTLDPYIEVFEEGDEVARHDWRLARDLVLIRMVERLYERGWLGNNVDALPEESDDNSDTEA
ncbi:MAG: type I-B CRISPR-associated protein Cas8b1/Cst1 [Nitrospirae bacterium]|nr:MAG: type I-B CRISPR-associated protein Cas8b1/Cst1 [Nitrospirota bacterium]